MQGPIPTITKNYNKKTDLKLNKTSILKKQTNTYNKLWIRLLSLKTKLYTDLIEPNWILLQNHAISTLEVFLDSGFLAFMDCVRVEVRIFFHFPQFYHKVNDDLVSYFIFGCNVFFIKFFSLFLLTKMLYVMKYTSYKFGSMSRHFYIFKSLQ